MNGIKKNLISFRHTAAAIGLVLIYLAKKRADDGAKVNNALLGI